PEREGDVRRGLRQLAEQGSISLPDAHRRATVRQVRIGDPDAQARLLVTERRRVLPAEEVDLDARPGTPAVEHLARAEIEPQARVADVAVDERVVVAQLGLVGPLGVLA